MTAERPLYQSELSLSDAAEELGKKALQLRFKHYPIKSAFGGEGRE
ncbi:MAG: hypothetical protein KME43_05480 [Myxacorys chilensis ATA2-1-KO14]|jgi:hypothetical protein|nr:hypothetical protein [Myxacorys chilensis ATA2-1-KO14]